MCPSLLLLLFSLSLPVLPSGRTRRDIFDNIALDDPESPCRNGGVHAGGRCHCIPPHTGRICQDFICVHGISVGKRFEPRSLFFNRPCICDKGWTGDLCEYHLSEKCSNHGEWRGDHCECIGFFFGPSCQFTSKCVMGIAKQGRCICHEDWEGEYCHKIICHHGSANVKNKSMSCTCSKRHAGEHCDMCKVMPYPVTPYPDCQQVKKKIRERKPPRKLATSNNYSRVIVLVTSISCLILVIIGMAYASYKYSQSKQQSVRRRAHEEELKERKEFLEGEAKQSKEEIQIEEEPQSLNRSWRWGSGKKGMKRKGSLGSFFRNVTTRRTSEPV